MSKELWLTCDTYQETLQIPVNPPELKISSGSQNDSFNVFNLGEVTVLQKPKASTYIFESFFPKMPGPYLDINPDDLWEPGLYVAQISIWQSQYRPIRFIVTDSNINILCSIEDFSYSERGGDVDTIYYSLTLKEYNVLTPRILKNVNGKLLYEAKPIRPSAG